MSAINHRVTVYHTLRLGGLQGAAAKTTIIASDLRDAFKVLGMLQASEELDLTGFLKIDPIKDD